MKKNIMILGAGLMQKPAILSAKELGCKTFVVDANPNAVCADEADVFEVIDLKNRDELFEYAKKIDWEEGLDAVFTAGTDFSANVAYIAEKLDLPGHSYQAALNASDKVLMRKCFLEHGVASPAFKEVTLYDLAELKNSPEKFLKKNGFSPDEFPYVVKPCDSMGGRGCRMVNDFPEIYDALKNAIKYSRSGRAIFEEYMDGREFSIDALVFDGKIIITGFAERHIHFAPYFIEMGHTMSAVLTQNEYDELRNEFVQGIRSLGLTHGVAKADIKLSKKGAMIGEIAARLSGGYMSGWTFPYASGINLTRQAILLALGEKCELESSQNTKEFYGDVVPSKSCAERAWISIPGRVAQIYGLDEATKIEGIQDVLPRVKVGDDVVFPKNNVEKCGNVISLSSSREKAMANAEKAVSSIVIRLEKNNPVTDAFFAYATDDAYDIPPAYTSSAIQFPEDSSPDWNYRSLDQTASLFKQITGFEIDFSNNDADYLRYLYRGGIQGLLYWFDSFISQ